MHLQLSPVGSGFILQILARAPVPTATAQLELNFYIRHVTTRLNLEMKHLTTTIES